MKHSLFLLTLLLLCSACKEKIVLEESEKLICLDNYIIPAGKAGIEIARVLNADSCVITLAKDTSKLFRIDEKGILLLQDGKSVSASGPFRYGIEIKCNNGIKSFELVRDDFVRNKVVAHRGAWKHHDVSENSIGSLKAAIELGCEGVEFDVWYSADDHIVLSHDRHIGGMAVEETSVEELRKIVLKNNENLPTLKEYIEIIKTQNQSRLVLEIKPWSEKGPERSLELAEAAVRLVHEEKAQAWVEYISFGYDVLKRVRGLDASARISYLENDRTIEEIQADGFSGVDFHYTHYFDDETLNRRSHEKGLTTNAWTVNQPEDMIKLLDMGIDYITTDEPEILLGIVHQ